MYNKLRVILIIFAFLSLVVIGYDYVCGHMDENPFDSNYCPICAISNSIELGHLVFVSLLFFGIFSLTGFINLRSAFFYIPFYLSIFPDRSPPTAE